LITDKKDEVAALDLIHSCGAWAMSIGQAVLVFQNSFWRPDHNLWEAIQKVCKPTLSPEDYFLRFLPMMDVDADLVLGVLG
jgi:hypothetical protein